MPINHRGVLIAGPRANYTPTKPMYLSTDISGGNARLIFTPLYANLKYNIKKTLIKV